MLQRIKANVHEIDPDMVMQPTRIFLDKTLSLVKFSD